MKSTVQTYPFHTDSYPSFLTERINNYYNNRVYGEWDGGHILRGKQQTQRSVKLMSNDYLSLSDHPDIRKAQVSSLQLDEESVVMSPIFLHGDTPQSRFEKNMAEFLNTERSLLCQSGWAANVGLVQSIAKKGTPVYADISAHMSMWNGIQLAGAKGYSFRHNDVSHLERKISRYGPGIVMVDSVYSTNGSIAKLIEIVEVAKRYGCIMVVDESHSLGTHGPQGKGLVAELGIGKDVHFITASLAKSFAGRAGIVTCTEEFYDYFMTTAHPAIFSSALLQHEIIGLEKTLQIIKNADDRRLRLHKNADFLRSSLKLLGYNVDIGNAQIIALETGSERKTMEVRDALEERDVFGSIFCAPATAKNKAIVRFTINSAMTPMELMRVVDACENIRDQVKLAEWESTKRLQ